MHNNNNYEYEEVTAVFFLRCLENRSCLIIRQWGHIIFIMGLQKKKKKSIMRQLATVLAFVLNVTEGDVFKQWLPGSLSPLLG